MSFNNLAEFILDDRYISEELKQKIREKGRNYKRNKYFFELYFGPEISSYWKFS